MTYTLTYNARPWSLNVERQGNRWKRAALVSEWRDAFRLLAKQAKVPKLSRIDVTVEQTLRNRAGIPDTGACIGAVKAAIDGVVEAGVLPDDGPEYVTGLHFLAPRVTGTDSLILTIREDTP